MKKFILVPYHIYLKTKQIYDSNLKNSSSQDAPSAIKNSNDANGILEAANLADKSPDKSPNTLSNFGHREINCLKSVTPF